MHNLRREQLPDFLENHYGVRFSRKTLAKMASLGTGPAYRRIGRTVIYSAADVENWVKARSTGRGTKASALPSFFE